LAQEQKKAQKRLVLGGGAKDSLILAFKVKLGSRLIISVEPVWVPLWVGFTHLGTTPVKLILFSNN
jgi:hypothetical protein